MLIRPQLANKSESKEMMSGNMVLNGWVEIFMIFAWSSEHHLLQDFLTDLPRYLTHCHGQKQNSSEVCDTTP